MNLTLNISKAEGYISKSQIGRVISEDWVKSNGYCPSCGKLPLNEFVNNRPVADFFCNSCDEEFELKSKNGKFSNVIIDGAYTSMIERIKAENNPNFFFLNYNKELKVENFLIIPKQFFTEDIIIKRAPLKETARRAGWIGCNIDISKISKAGKVFLVKNSNVIDAERVNESFKKTLFLRQKSKVAKGWILDIMNCVDSIDKESFSLDEVYKFEDSLKNKYPNNNYIKDKIRQQLQLLRDRGILEFEGRGKYRKI
ncbi:MAG: restriction endonuclease [Chitinophagaceae bacterium]|nr:MAG: restriction endonuclease [Chitinophagaceae bacterium]